MGAAAIDTFICALPRLPASGNKGHDQTLKHMCESKSARPEDPSSNASGAHAVHRVQADLEGWQGAEVEDERPGLVCQPPRGGVGQGGAGSKGHPRQQKPPLHCERLNIRHMTAGAECIVSTSCHTLSVVTTLNCLLGSAKLMPVTSQSSSMSADQQHVTSVRLKTQQCTRM